MSARNPSDTKSWLRMLHLLPLDEKIRNRFRLGRITELRDEVEKSVGHEVMVTYTFCPKREAGPNSLKISESAFC